MGKVAINLVTGSIQQKEIIVGIDLGTTNSLIAIVHPDTRQPVALKEIDGLTLVPSIVHFDEFGNPTVGNMAKARLVAAPERTVYSVKRLMGKSYKDVKAHADFFSYKIIDDDTDSLVKIQINDKFYNPIELSAEILRELKHRAEHILKTHVSKAVITVPAYFNDSQRQSTRDAGRFAGLDVLRIINEPTAASLAYGLGVKSEEEKTIAVEDKNGEWEEIIFNPLEMQDFKYEVKINPGLMSGVDKDMFNALVFQFVQNGQLTFKEALEVIEIPRKDKMLEMVTARDEQTAQMEQIAAQNEQLQMELIKLKGNVAPDSLSNEEKQIFEEMQREELNQQLQGAQPAIRALARAGLKIGKIGAQFTRRLVDGLGLSGCIERGIVVQEAAGGNSLPRTGDERIARQGQPNSQGVAG